MSTYHVVHGRHGTAYTVTECGDRATVSWEDNGNGAGSANYAASQVQDYLARGVWKLAGQPTSTLFADIVPPGSTVESGCSGGLGMFRPALESRKVGKVRVELVDDGFTLALREVAKVMTWAQTAKGYKDHDWMNLPEAEIQLAAAASRHRTDHIVQRLIEDKPALECVDPESALMHKAHEAFGVLAQLEYMLRNKPQ